MACVAVASLLRTIELGFLQSRPRPLVLEYDLISSNKHLIQSFHQKLVFLIKQFDENRMDGVEAIKHLETKLRDLAFKVEDEIEFLVAYLYDGEVDEEELRRANLCLNFFILVSNFTKIFKLMFKTRPCLKLGQIFQCAIQEIDAIEKELVKIKNSDKLEGRQTSLDFPPSFEVDSSQHASHSEERMVGKNDEFEVIKELLTQLGSKQKQVVSIIGMGGIGKTTLALRVYEDPSIAMHFDVRAWIVASQLHNKRQMLIGLLSSISKQRNAESSTYEDLALKLYQSLKRQRYIVVIDDVWSGEAWDDVSKCFPDDGNGSRVLLTTRLVEVANYTSSGNEFSHQMQLLNQSDSWNLFCEKASRYRGGAEFETIGRPIVEKCKGLPLAIVVVAGLFSKLNTLDEWEKIAKALDSSATATIAATSSKILLLSFNHLPHHLKACFLYLGVFPEDHEINVNELARLWSAEGLVKASAGENFDAVAKKHAQELMDRNLILVSKWSCCGRKIKVFKVHDLLHAFCVREAHNENLLHIVRKNGSYFPQKYFRWVSMQSSHPNVSTHYFSRGCRSIFCFSRYKSLNLESFKLLRVFFFTVCWMHNDIVDFVHLRYLPPILYDFKILHLFRAWNLQTVHSVYIDANYFEFPQQQHFKCSCFHGYPPKFVHQNLQSISWLDPNQCTKEFFTHFPFVKKISILMEDETYNLNDCIESLAYLQQLERLYIDALEFPFMIQLNNHIVALKNVKRLVICAESLEWKGINILCKLPRLEVLKLAGDARVGKEWELPENDKFYELIFLELRSVGLKDWKGSGDHFPKLEHLLLRWCKELEEIPSGFAEISTLKSIKLKGCLPSVVTSANQIKEEQVEYMNNIVDVVVT